MIIEDKIGAGLVLDLAMALFARFQDAEMDEVASAYLKSTLEVLSAYRIRIETETPVYLSLETSKLLLAIESELFKH